MMKNRVTNIHFVGIGGVGMSGIAEVLHNLGFKNFPVLIRRVMLLLSI